MSTHTTRPACAASLRGWGSVFGTIPQNSSWPRFELLVDVREDRGVVGRVGSCRAASARRAARH
jgi:hypothetical protein